MSKPLNDDEVEKILQGKATSRPLGAILESIRSHFASIDPAEPNDELQRFVSVELLHASDTKDKKMLPALLNFAGTVVGKVLLTTTVAAASVGGAHATGIVEVPVIPEVATAVASVVADTAINIVEVIDVVVPVDIIADPEPVVAEPVVAEPATPEPVVPTTVTPEPVVTTTSTTTTEAPVPRFVLVAQTFDVLEVGTVTVEGNTDIGLTILATTFAQGWDVEVEQADLPGEASVSFRSGGDRVDFDALIVDDQLRVSVRDRRTDTRGDQFFDADGNPVDGNPVVDPTPIPASQTFDVLEVGTVTIGRGDDAQLAVLETTSTTGWAVSTDQAEEPGEVSVTFRNDDARVDFKASVEDGQLRIRVRDRRTDTRNEEFFDLQPVGTPNQATIDLDDSDDVDQDDDDTDVDQDDDDTDVDQDDDDQDSPDADEDQDDDDQDSPDADEDQDDDGQDSPDADEVSPLIVLRSMNVFDAGSVTFSTVVNGDSLSRIAVTSVAGTNGWSAEILSGNMKVRFENGDNRIDFEAIFNNGEVTINIRHRGTDQELDYQVQIVDGQLQIEAIS
jgi:hypothetical protein